MSQGLMPSCASSTIRSLMALGRGLPLTNTPPSWFTSPKAGSVSKRTNTAVGHGEWLKGGSRTAYHCEVDVTARRSPGNSLHASLE